MVFSDYTQYGPIKNQHSDFEKKRTSSENSGLKEHIYLLRTFVIGTYCVYYKLEGSKKSLH